MRNRCIVASCAVPSFSSRELEYISPGPAAAAMKLSAKTRYGVRAVFDIAFHCQMSPCVAIQAKDIAKREQVPLRYLEQIFQDLRRAGLVESKRGPKGGYLLKRPASEITLAALVTALQGPIEESYVEDENEQSEHGVPNSSLVTTALWKELGSVVTEWFEGITVEDLVKRGKELGLAGSCDEIMYFI